MVLQLHSLVVKIVPKKILKELETLHLVAPKLKHISPKKQIVMAGSFKNRRVSPATETAVRTTFHMKTSRMRSASINRNRLKWLGEILKALPEGMQRSMTIRGCKISSTSSRKVLMTLTSKR